MSTHRRLHFGTCVVLIPLVLSGTARGQTAAASLPELAVLVGARVEVVDSKGSVLKGRLIEASATGLRLNVKRKEVRMAGPHIEEVSRRSGDSLWNGALIGAAIAGAPPLIQSASVDLASGEWNDAILVSAFHGGIGAGLGAAIDALIQTKKTVPFRAAAPQVAVAPMLAAGRTSVAVSVRF